MGNRASQETARLRENVSGRPSVTPGVLPREGRLVRNGSRIAIAAVMAALSQVGCSGEADDQQDYTDVAAETAAETPEYAGKAYVQFNGDDWVFGGYYPESFELKVYSSTEASMTQPEYTEDDVVFEDTVTIDEEGQFKLKGYGGSDDTVWVTVKAFQSDTGEEITISGNPGPEGMYGSPYAIYADRL